MNRRLRTWIVIGAGVACAAVTTVTAAAGAKDLSAEDRTAIEQLLAHYQTALSSCAAEDYAKLFVDDGVFTSNDFRGAKHRELYGQSNKLVGHEQLMQLVRTEEFCMHPQQQQQRRTQNRPAAPPATISETPEGAVGIVPFSQTGHYEDVYVKTRDGWKFKSRTVFMPPVSPAK